MRAWLEEVLVGPEPVYRTRVVPDELEQISSALRQMADEDGCSLILTTGGIGPAPRDVTPEATESVCQKMMPGFGEEMRRKSLEVVPTAILSRQVAGVRGSCLIINLPGKPSAIADCLNAVFPAVPYCLDLVGGAYLETAPEKVNSFRPGKVGQSPSEAGEGPTK